MPQAPLHRSRPALRVASSYLALPAFALALALGCGGKHTVAPPPPTLSGYTPLAGEANTQVAVYGTGLGEGVVAVTCCGVPVPLNDVTVGLLSYSPDNLLGNTSLNFAVPANAVTGPIVVTTQGGTITTGTFTVIPSISSVAPASGSLAAGTPVTVTGSGLEGIASISFGGVPATPTSTTPNEIVVPLPATTPQGTQQITFVMNPAYVLPDLQWPFTVNP